MQTEIEAKFLGINREVMRAKLRALGAVCKVPRRTMRRKVYDYPDERLDRIGAWVRVRDEGTVVTVSYKQQQSRGLHGTKEVILTVDGFDAADQFLMALGLVQKAYQETKRESWQLGEVHVDLDEWPWIRPYMEIEGPSERSVRTVANELGLDWTTAVFGAAIPYLAEFAVTEQEVNHWTSITFGSAPEGLERKRKPQASL